MMKKILKYVVIVLIVFILVFATVSITSRKTINETIKLTYSSKNVINAEGTQAVGDMNSKAMGFSNYLSEDSVAAVTYEEAAFETGDYAVEESNVSGTDATMDDLLEVKGDYVHWTHNSVIETTEYNAVCDELAGIIDNAGGYIEDSDIVSRSETDNKGNEHTVRRGTFTIRIPENNVKEIEDVLKGDKAQLISTNSYGEDLTESYVKSDKKIKSYEEELAKLESLLENATDIEDILAINDRITSINYELEYYNDIIQRINKDVNFSTYYLTIDEVIYYEDTIEQYQSDIAQSWAYVFEDWFSTVLPELFLILISAIPFLIIIGITVFKTSKKIVDYKIKATQKD